MVITLIVLSFLALTELSLWLVPFWRHRKVLSAVLALANTVCSAILIVVHPALWSLLFMMFSAYRVVNMLRIRANRVHADYLFHTTRRTSAVLIIVQFAVLGAALALQYLTVSAIHVTYFVSSVVTICIAFISVYGIRQFSASKTPAIDNPVHPSELPSLSVLIPARNETVELEACLRSLISSTYKKLEIIVLDDCSQNKRTPEIIREFAHNGVLFIAGEAPPDHWLAKNYAYRRLAHEANGEILLFCGVDVRFEPDSLTQMVQSMLTKQKGMLSLAPCNVLPQEDSLLSSLAQTGRYAWEFLLPRRFIGRPAVLSTCWMITRQALAAAGGFEGFKQSVLPERHLAARAVAQHDSYSFMRSPASLGVSTSKAYIEQFATAVRTRYPLLHKRPETVAAYTLAVLLICVWPYVLLIAAVLQANLPLIVLSIVCCLALGCLGGLITAITYRRPLLRGILLLPMLVVYDVCVLNYSMWQYEFKEVLWKGRNICLPVMHVITRLPPLDR